MRNQNKLNYRNIRWQCTCTVSSGEWGSAHCHYARLCQTAGERKHRLRTHAQENLAQATVK